MKYVFIGGGAMSTALIGGMEGSGKSINGIKVVDPDEAQLKRLTAAFPQIQCYSYPQPSLFEGVDVVVLAVKPQLLQSVARQLASFVSEVPVVLSVAAGVRAKDISRWLGGYPAVIRAMPSTATRVRAGSSGAFASSGANEIARNCIHEMLESVGNVYWVLREETLDVVTALSGSGPAYVFYFLENLEAAGRSLGLKEEEAHVTALNVLSGALALARQSNAPFAELRAQVTSKGGTTERALRVLDQAGAGKTLQKAVHASWERAVELGDELSVDYPAPDVR